MGWGDSDSEEDEKLMEFFNTPLNNQGGEQLSSLDDGDSYTLHYCRLDASPTLLFSEKRQKILLLPITTILIT